MDYYDILLAKQLNGGGGGEATLIDKNISSNGTYNASSDNADGYKKVVVSVPNPSTGTISITQNGTVDVTNYASASVNVSGWTSDGLASGTEPNGALTLATTTEIVAYAFYGNKAITSVSGSAVTKINQNAFQKCSNITQVNFPNVTEIGAGAFREDSKLTSASFPSATNLNTDTFRQCANMVSISVPSALKIGTYFAYDNQKLTSVVMTSATEVGSNAFQQCYTLELLDCPSVATISANACYNARKLATLILRSQSVVALANVSAFGNTPIRGYDSLSGTIYVPQALISSYQTASNWSSIYNEGHVTFSAIEGSIYE